MQATYLNQQIDTSVGSIYENCDLINIIYMIFYQIDSFFFTEHFCLMFSVFLCRFFVFTRVVLLFLCCSFAVLWVESLSVSGRMSRSCTDQSVHLKDGWRALCCVMDLWNIVMLFSFFYPITAVERKDFSSSLWTILHLLLKYVLCEHYFGFWQNALLSQAAAFK